MSETITSLRQSATNLRKNLALSVLAVALVIGWFWIGEKAGRPTSSQHPLQLAAILMIIKAESRPQPFVVTVLGIVVGGTAVSGALSDGSIGTYLRYASFALALPLVFSKQLFPTQDDE